EPSGLTSLTAPPNPSATKTSPAASTATSSGTPMPELVAMVVTEPSVLTSLTAPWKVSATKTSPTASTATPSGSRKPEPRVVATVGVKEGSVEYWKRATVLAPLGLTVALSVAPVAEMALAAPVVTEGGVKVWNDSGGLCGSATVPLALAA